MASIKSEIQKINNGFSEAFRKGNAAQVAAAYTAGAIVLPPKSEMVKGADAIESLWKAVMGMGIKDVKLETMEVEAHDNIAVEVGRYTLYVAEGMKADHGKYVVVWKKVRGTWKLHRDIWNTSKSD
jgi:uncharacterized protein (TIGR02246 family)